MSTFLKANHQITQCALACGWVHIVIDKWICVLPNGPIALANRRFALDTAFTKTPSQTLNNLLSLTTHWQKNYEIIPLLYRPILYKFVSYKMKTFFDLEYVDVSHYTSFERTHTHTQKHFNTHTHINTTDSYHFLLPINDF